MIWTEENENDASKKIDPTGNGFQLGYFLYRLWCDQSGCLRNGVPLFFDSGRCECGAEHRTPSGSPRAFILKTSQLTDSITLTIQGGWNQTFTTRSTDPTLTVVNGMGRDSVFYIYASTDESISVAIDGLTITNGLTPRTEGASMPMLMPVSTSTTDTNLTLTLSNNWIVDNSTWGNGGGLYAYASTSLEHGQRHIGSHPYQQPDCRKQCRWFGRRRLHLQL